MDERYDGRWLPTSGAGFLRCNIRASITVDSLPLAEQVAGEPTMQSSVTTENRGVINYIGAGGGSANYSGDVVFPGMDTSTDFNDFVLEATGRVTIPAAGNWTFGVNSDDGFSLQLKNGATTFSMSYPSPRGPGDTLQTFNFPAAGVYDLRLLFFERNGGSEVELFAAQGSFGTFNAASFRLVGNTAGGGLAVASNPVAGGNVAGNFATNVETAMRGVNASSYLRVPFNVANVNDYSSLYLRMKYDDGFVAYLNGQEIARRNAPGSPVYNSTAGGDRPASQAVVYEDINVTANIGLLHNGPNVLAIHCAQ